MLHEPHGLARLVDLDPGPLGEQAQVSGRTAQRVAECRGAQAEIADEPEIARVERGAEVQAEARVARGGGGVLEQRDVGGEREACPLATQRGRVEPGPGQHRLRRQPLRAQELDRLSGERGVDLQRHATQSVRAIARFANPLDRAGGISP